MREPHQHTAYYAAFCQSVLKPSSFLSQQLTLQCYRDFMCQAGNTDTAKSKPNQKCQIPHPIASVAFLTLLSVPSTCLLFQNVRSKIKIRGFRFSLQDQKSDWDRQWWLYNTVNIVSATELDLKMVKVIMTHESYHNGKIRTYITKSEFLTLQTLVRDKTVCVMSLSRRLLIKLLP